MRVCEGAGILEEPMARFESESVRIVRRNAPLLAVAGACVAILASMWAAGEFMGGTTSLLAGIATLAWLWIRNPWPIELHVAVEASPRGLSIDGAFLVGRDEILNAFLQPDPGGPLLKLASIGGRHLELRVDSEADGRALLDALELSGRRALAVFAARSARGRHGARRGEGQQTIAVSSMVILGVLLARMNVGLAIAFAGPLLFFGFQRLVSGKVLVGADGFLLDWFGRRRFVPYRDVTEILLSVRAVHVVLASGEELQLLVPMRHYADSGERDALHLALSDRKAVVDAARDGRDARVDASAEEAVGRGERSVRAWLESVRTVNELGSATYRVASLPTSALWRIVEDPGAEPSARVGAAVALRSTLDEAGRERVRVAAEGSTSPWVRVALDPVFAEGSDDDLTRALEEVDGELSERGERDERASA